MTIAENLVKMGVVEAYDYSDEISEGVDYGVDYEENKCIFKIRYIYDDGSSLIFDDYGDEVGFGDGKIVDPGGHLC